MKFAWVLVCAAIVAVGIAACDGSSSSGPTASADSGAGASAAAAAMAPTHNWQYKEGQEYGYAEAISDDDRKAGTAAATVHMFRYLGVRNGEYVLQASAGATASCANPCQVIRLGEGPYAQRVAFNPNSIIGAAFTDAINGQMEVFGSTPAGTPPPSGAPVAETAAADPYAPQQAAPTANNDAYVCAHGDQNAEATVRACDRKDGVSGSGAQ